MLSPYQDYTIGSPQYTWLLNDLQAIDRTVTPFVRSRSLPLLTLNSVPHALSFLREGNSNFGVPCRKQKPSAVSFFNLDHVPFTHDIH